MLPNPDKLNWSSFTVTDGIALPAFTMDDSVDLHADGNVALNLLDGVVVAKSGFDLTLGQVSGSDSTTTPAPRP